LAVEASPHHEVYDQMLRSGAAPAFIAKFAQERFGEQISPFSFNRYRQLRIKQSDIEPPTLVKQKLEKQGQVINLAVEQAALYQMAVVRAERLNQLEMEMGVPLPETRFAQQQAQELFKELKETYYELGLERTTRDVKDLMIARFNALARAGADALRSTGMGLGVGGGALDLMSPSEVYRALKDEVGQKTEVLHEMEEMLNEELGTQLGSE